MAMSHAWGAPKRESEVTVSPQQPQQQAWPVEYYACLNGVEVTSVDIVSQHFSARGFITMMWVDKELAAKAEKAGSPIPDTSGSFKSNYILPDNGWILPLNPDDVFANAIEYTKVSGGLAYDGDTGVASQSIKWIATFAQSMWLARFPFDRMHCGLALKNQRKTFRLCADEPEWMNKTNTKCQIWDHQRVNLSLALAPRVYAEYRLMSLGNHIFSQDNEVLSKPVLFARLQRKSTFYIWAIIMPCCLFGLISVATCGMVSMDGVQDRLGINTTMLLTVVALKLMTGYDLPKVSYMTWLDYYYAATTLYICGTIGVNVLSAEWAVDHDVDYDAAAKKDWERSMMTFLGVCWTVLHVLILLGNYFQWWSRSWHRVASMQQQDDQNTKVSRSMTLTRTASARLVES